MRHLPLLLIGFPALAYSGFVAVTLDEPVCSPYVFSYNNAGELAAMTSIQLAGMSLCSASAPEPTASATISSTDFTFTSTGAAVSTSIAVVNDPCNFTAYATYPNNPGFECTDTSSPSNFGWYLNQANLISTELAHGGSYVLSLNSKNSGARIDTRFPVVPGDTVEVTFWARLALASDGLSGCILRANVSPGDVKNKALYGGLRSFGIPPPSATKWTSYTFIFLALGTAPDTALLWGGCSSPTDLYVDDFTVSSRTLPDDRNYCVYSASSTYPRNPGFECADLNNFGWHIEGAGLTTITFAHGGLNVLTLLSEAGSSGRLNQTFPAQVGDSIVISFWARLQSADVPLSGCAFQGYTPSGSDSPATSLYDFSYAVDIDNTPPSATDWIPYSFSFSATDSAVQIAVAWSGCQNHVALYVDDFTLSTKSNTVVTIQKE